MLRGHAATGGLGGIAGMGWRGGGGLATGGQMQRVYRSGIQPALQTARRICSSSAPEPHSRRDLAHDQPTSSSSSYTLRTQTRLSPPERVTAALALIVTRRAGALAAKRAMACTGASALTVTGAEPLAVSLAGSSRSSSSGSISVKPRLNTDPAATWGSGSAPTSGAVAHTHAATGPSYCAALVGVPSTHRPYVSSTSAGQPSGAPAHRLDRNALHEKAGSPSTGATVGAGPGVPISMSGW